MALFYKYEFVHNGRSSLVCGLGSAPSGRVSAIRSGCTGSRVWRPRAVMPRGIRPRQRWRPARRTKRHALLQN